MKALGNRVVLAVCIDYIIAAGRNDIVREGSTAVVFFGIGQEDVFKGDFLVGRVVQFNVILIDIGLTCIHAGIHRTDLVDPQKKRGIIGMGTVIGGCKGKNKEEKRACRQQTQQKQIASENRAHIHKASSSNISTSPSRSAYMQGSPAVSRACPLVASVMEEVTASTKETGTRASRKTESVYSE